MVLCMPICFEAASSFIANRSCISGSPPLSVNPPAMALRPWRYLPSSAAAFVTLTGMPLRIVHVSGLWQYWQRHMHPVVHATTRTPGPSTAEPVVNECRNPMSPVSSAPRTSVSGTSSPRFTRISNGLFAARGVCAAASPATIVSASVERAIDHVHLLFAREAHEVHCVARYADREARVLLRMLHRIEQRLAIEHVDVHVVAGGREESIQHRS